MLELLDANVMGGNGAMHGHKVHSQHVEESSNLLR